VVVEGAGSCAEVNLRDRDFVNFDVLHGAITADGDHSRVAALLVANIDKGGVFAQVIGTLACLRPEDRALVKGIIVNCFRGDESLFADGRQWLEDQTGLPVLAVVPWFDPHEISVDAEDGLKGTALVDPPTLREAAAQASGDQLAVAVLLLPHIANHTDFEPLQRDPRVRLHFLSRPRPLGVYDLCILPGSKSVRGDLLWLRRRGWEPILKEYADRGGALLGICGGYQMLGRWLDDPSGVESGLESAGGPRTEGLGLLPVTTELMPAGQKVLRTVEGTWLAPCILPVGQLVKGYEIHAGITTPAGEVPTPPACIFTRLTPDCDGVTSDVRDGCHCPGPIAGTYLHGLFDAPGVVESLMHTLRPDVPPLQFNDIPDPSAHCADLMYDKLAAHFLDALDMPRLQAIIRPTREQTFQPPTDSALSTEDISRT